MTKETKDTESIEEADDVRAVEEIESRIAAGDELVLDWDKGDKGENESEPIYEDGGAGS